MSKITTGIKRYIAAFGMLCGIMACACAATVPGVFLQDGGWLWTEQADGSMKASVKMTEGTALDVEASGEKDAAGEPYAKTKEAAYEGSKGKTLSFAEVHYDGKTYWAISNRIVLQKTPAVILEECAMYNTKSLADVINGHLDRGSGVAVGKTSITTGNVSIVEVCYYSQRLYAVRTVYVKADKVSTALDDSTAFKILSNAEKTADAEKKKALLASADALNLSPKVREVLQKAQDDMDNARDMLSDGTKMFTRPLVIHTKDGSKINVRSVPGSAADGTVIAQLEDGEQVRPLLRTQKMETIEGITAPWLMLSSPHDGGWIFGGYVASGSN